MSSNRAQHGMITFVVAKRRATVPRISAAALKAVCLELIDAIERTGVSVIVTKRGRAVARLEPVRTKATSAFGLLRGRIAIRGDIVEPIDVRWRAAT